MLTTFKYLGSCHRTWESSTSALLLKSRRESGHPRGCGARRRPPAPELLNPRRLNCASKPPLPRHTSRYRASQTLRLPQIKNEALHQQRDYDPLYSETPFAAAAGGHHGMSPRCVCAFLGQVGCKRSSVRRRESGRSSRLYHFPVISITC